MNYECITTRLEADKVAIITLNRPSNSMRSTTN